MSAAIWITRTGKRIRVRHMDDRHLLNTIAMLERNAARKLQAEINAGYSFLAGLQGEMAQFCCEQDIDRLEETTPAEWLEQRPIYRSLVAEAERRKLALP